MVLTEVQEQFLSSLNIFQYCICIFHSICIFANLEHSNTRLFENDKTQGNKFSGEEFKLILKECCPFIEVIVITQKDIVCGDFGTIKKYCVNIQHIDDETGDKYYDDNLKPALIESIKIIKGYRAIAGNIELNNNIDKCLVEKITNAIERNYVYNGLKTEDISEIIELFKKIERRSNES